jgi:hypothetical protein
MPYCRCKPRYRRLPQLPAAFTELLVGQAMSGPVAEKIRRAGAAGARYARPCVGVTVYINYE